MVVVGETSTVNGEVEDPKVVPSVKVPVQGPAVVVTVTVSVVLVPIHIVLSPASEAVGRGFTVTTTEPPRSAPVPVQCASVRAVTW